jgi:protein-tyrosine phosphatase
MANKRVDVGAREYRVLMVCLGNICRSPTATAVLRVLAAKALEPGNVYVEGAGTADYHIGEPPDRRSVEHGLRRGYDLRQLRARQVVSQDFHDFDLILSVDRPNLACLRRSAPDGARARLGLLLDYAPQQPLREVPDPYYGQAADFERVLDLCEWAAQGLLSSWPPDR